MLSHTHRLIATHVQKNIIDLTGIQIDLTSFIYGAVAPDLHPHLFFGMHHYREDSEDFVYKQMEKILHTKWTNQNNRRLSYVLGLICHFTSDYSCYPHVYHFLFTDNFRSHFVYEADLQRLMKGFDNADLALEINQQPPSEISYYKAKYVAYEDTYHATPHSPDKDIRFAVGTSSIILSELLLARTHHQRTQ